MNVVVLGSGSCAPTARRGSSGLLVYTGSTTLLLDGGGGVVEKLVQTDRSYTDLAAVLYTHLHCDHTGGIVPLIFALNNTPLYTRDKPLPIYGPRGLTEFIEGLPAAWPKPWLAPEGYEILTTELGSGTFTVGDVGVAAEPVEHAGIPCIGYRLESGGVSLAYSGDTGECEGILKLAQGVDLLILECSHADGVELAGHLTPSQCGRIATRAGAKRLLLTHMYADCDEVDIAAQCRNTYTGEVTVAEDLMRVEV